MAMTNVELYEALKGSIPEDAARMIAGVVPPAKELATRSDLVGVQVSLLQEIAGVRQEFAGEFAGVRQEFAGLRQEFAGLRQEFAANRQETAELRGDLKAVARLQQWMLGFFVPLWVGTFGTLIAVVLKS